MHGGPVGGAGTLTVHRTTGLTCSRLLRFVLSLRASAQVCMNVCSEPNRSPFQLMFSVCDLYGDIGLLFFTFSVGSFWFSLTRVGNVCESRVCVHL